MSRMLSILLLLSMVICSACGPAFFQRDETVTAINGARAAISTISTLAEVAYDAHHRVEFERFDSGELTEEQLVLRWADLRKRWAPLWRALDAARGAHAALLAALDENAPAGQLAALAAKLASTQRDAAQLLETLNGKRSK